MEIAEVEPIGLEADVEEPFGFSQAWVDKRTATLVRIESRDGEVGWGECWGPVAGNYEMVAEFLGPEIEGREVADVRSIFDELCDFGLGAYHSVIPYTAISGVDIALWDLKGKALGEPVSTLLGGRHHKEVVPYATGHYFKHDADLDEQCARISAEAAENAETFDAVKLKVGLEFLGYGPEADVRLVREVRDAVGDETKLLVDANYAYDTATAREVGQALEESDVYLFEEPVRPENVDGYAHLRDALNMRIAGGECNDIHGLQRLLEENALDIAQPDVCTIGGLSGAQRICEVSRLHDTPIVPHVWGTPITIAASAHLLSTLPTEPWLEYDRSSNPLRENLVTQSFEVTKDGTVAVPEEPGLGITVDRDILNRYRVK